MKRWRDRILEAAKKLGLHIQPWRPHRYPTGLEGVTNRFDLVERFEDVPGMVSAGNGFRLYLAAMCQAMEGDIVEVGSWLGRCTCFLAQACEDRGGSTVFAVDHFQGNPGKEGEYGLDRMSPGDLRDAFLHNLESRGLAHRVRLHDAPSEVAFERIRAEVAGVRLVFIDGDHRYEGALRDIRLYSSLLSPGGLLILDDFATAFPGVVRAAREAVLGARGWGRGVQWENQLMIQKLPAPRD